MEVAVTGMLVLAEDDRGVGAGGSVVEEGVGAGVLRGAGGEVAAKLGCGPGWGRERHAVISLV